MAKLEVAGINVVIVFAEVRVWVFDWVEYQCGSAGEGFGSDASAAMVHCLFSSWTAQWRSHATLYISTGLTKHTPTSRLSPGKTTLTGQGRTSWQS